MLLTDLYIHQKDTIKKVSLDEQVVQQYQPGFIDSLLDFSFSIIKEPMGTYFVGMPFNLHLNSVEDITESLPFNLSPETLEILKSLQPYQCVILSLFNDLAQLVNVSYLYSIPSYSVFANGLNAPPIPPEQNGFDQGVITPVLPDTSVDMGQGEQIGTGDLSVGGDAASTSTSTSVGENSRFMQRYRRRYRKTNF